MIDQIFIPTLGRHNNQMTYDNMTPNAQAITTLVIQPKEAHLYPKHNTLILPDNDIGITETRRLIYMDSMDIKYFVIDDDMKFIRRTPGEEKSKRPMNESDWDYLLNTTSDWLDDFAWGGFRQGNLPPSGKEYLESAAVNCAFFFNGKKLPDESELDWSLSTVEDISMVLQLFQKGYNNRVWDRFGYLSNYVGTEGGCAEWRTLDLINNNHQKLINMYPQYVSWNGTKEILGGEFKKIKVKWKQAYLDSQRSKASLEEFL
tara:strand:- start:564 stop:1343 length:780 start_codon:yes stop_codon:yes gene_type:complete